MSLFPQILHNPISGGHLWGPVVRRACTLLSPATCKAPQTINQLSVNPNVDWVMCNCIRATSRTPQWLPRVNRIRPVNVMTSSDYQSIHSGSLCFQFVCLWGEIRGRWCVEFGCPTQIRVYTQFAISLGGFAGRGKDGARPPDHKCPPFRTLLLGCEVIEEFMTFFYFIHFWGVREVARKQLHTTQYTLCFILNLLIVWVLCGFACGREMEGARPPDHRTPQVPTT